MTNLANRTVPLADLHAARVSSNRSDEIREMITTLLGAFSTGEIVSVVRVEGSGEEVLALEPVASEAGVTTLEEIEARVRDQLASGTLGDFAVAKDGRTWLVNVAPIYGEFERIVGALIVAYLEESNDDTPQKVTRALGELLSLVVTREAHEHVRQHQRKLDDLVARVAERLMGATEDSRQEVLNWVMEALGVFMGADVTFLRRNDYTRELSCLVAEWPGREWGDTGPDPLGEVPFNSDPIFVETRDLKAPFFPGEEEAKGAYRERTMAGASGLVVSSGIAVPLLVGPETWGVLGFLHFELHAWTLEEVNALEAIASMLVHLQGRFDAEHNADHDELTGLRNRRAIIAELESRAGDERQFVAMLLDLDKFKAVNDTLGHGAGDDLLREMAYRIRSSIRPEDFSGRLGGDEFVVLLPWGTGEMEGMVVAERILKALARPIIIGEHTLHHSGSIGIAISDPSMSVPDILGCADVALYEAKSRGRNQAVLYDVNLGLPEVAVARVK